MLTIDQVKEYSDAFEFWPLFPEMVFPLKEEPEEKYKLRLCYMKDARLCRLTMSALTLDYIAFTAFANRDETLSEDMLIRSEDALQRHLPLGTHKVLKYA